MYMVLIQICLINAPQKLPPILRIELNKYAFFFLCAPDLVLQIPQLLAKACFWWITCDVLDFGLVELPSLLHFTTSWGALILCTISCDHMLFQSHGWIDKVIRCRLVDLCVVPHLIFLIMSVSHANIVVRTYVSKQHQREDQSKYLEI